MTPFTILAPNLATLDARLLRACLTSTRLPWSPPADDLSDRPARHVLSIGKAGLDVWHDFGLIQVGQNHGDVFATQGAGGRSHVVMVLEHPGALQQLAIGSGYGAREDMARDLTRWRHVLSGAADLAAYSSRVCGGCLKAKGIGYPRPAEHWVTELDYVGLCEDHYRKRSAYRRKVARVRVKDKGKMEHQIAGQMEMLPGDGTKVMVSKT